MKTYGLIVADNGTDMYVSGTWDDRWDNDILNPAFDALTASDFEVIQLGWRPPLAPDLAVDERAPEARLEPERRLEPGESVDRRAVVGEPAAGARRRSSGAASGVRGPAGATYTLADASAAYGSPAAGRAGELLDRDRRTAIAADGARVPPSRPAAHWDATVTREGQRDGGEDLDPPRRRQLRRRAGRGTASMPKIENLLHNGVTAGCSAGNFCPDTSVTRAQMAVFLLKSKLGRRLRAAARRRARCSRTCRRTPSAPRLDRGPRRTAASRRDAAPALFCPNAAVTRAQMAVFLLKARHGSDYVPPAAAGVFADVPPSNPFAPWIEQLAAEGVTAGCGGGNYCPELAEHARTDGGVPDEDVRAEAVRALKAKVESSGVES